LGQPWDVNAFAKAEEVFPQSYKLSPAPEDAIQCVYRKIKGNKRIRKMGNSEDSTKKKRNKY
jgi:hypothetical protein